MSRLKEIHDYLISTGRKEEVLNDCDHYSVYLSMEICEYAHRNQFRENGEEYAFHPFRCLKSYRDFVGIKDDDFFCIDKDKMYECGIPYEGIQELCLLHDVIEDTDFTIEEIEEIFNECGFELFFELYIKYPLINLTHIKGEDYEDYINRCLDNISSAIVKMIDMQDNMYVLSLNSLDEYKYNRGLKYYKYIKRINDKYHFIEGNGKYKEELKATS